MKKTLFTLAGASVLSMGAQAEQFWADNSVSLLQGSDYAMVDSVDDKATLTTMTLEHVSGHSWGGLFFFVDRHVGEDDSASGQQFKETYGEVSPKFTLVEMDGFVKSINAAFTYEFGSTSSGFSQDNYLYGVGADFAVPGLDYFGATYYYADNEAAEADDHQLTLVYGAHFGEVIVDGYIDYSTGTEVTDAQFHFNPQITYNVGSLMGLKNKVKVGVEYSYWANKFGVKDLDDKIDEQNAFSLLLKAHL